MHINTEKKMESSNLYLSNRPTWDFTRSLTTIHFFFNTSMKDLLNMLILKQFQLVK